MLNKQIIFGAAIVLSSNILSADIYDDYKLLAEAITINSEKIKKVDNKSSFEISNLFSKLQEENAKLEAKILALESKVKENSCNSPQHINESSNKELLKIEQREKLLRVIEDSKNSKENI